MIDHTQETVLPFSQAARRLPSLRGDKPVNPATLWRWAKCGVLARSGVRIRLETIRIGGSTCTSMEALQRFITALTADGTEQQPIAPALAGKRQRDTEERLDAAGI